MIVAESRASRRLVGRLDRGRDLFESLLAVCRERDVRSGEIRALGSFESVEVAEYDQARKVWKPGRHFTAGGMEVLHLTGNVSEREGALALHAHVALMRDRDNGVEIIGGHLVAARVFALEFVIDCFDDLVLRRRADADTGLVLWHEAVELRPTDGEAPAAAAPASAAPEVPDDEEELPPRFEAVVPKASSKSPSWAQVAAASARHEAPTREEPETDEMLAPGDVVVHPTFGRCEVQRIEGAGEFAHVRLKNGRLVRLSLDVLKLSRGADEAGRRVFRARVDG